MTSGQTDNELRSDDRLSDEEQQSVVDQFEEVQRRSQENYDSSVRTIAAGAVAVTASLTAAIGDAGWSGTAAVALSLACLSANLGSYWTAHWDAKATIKSAWDRDRRGVYESRWRRVTASLNAATFFLLLAAGICLVAFVSSSSA